MNDLPYPVTASWNGGVWTNSYNAKAAGDYLQQIHQVLHEVSGNCSKCQTAWIQLVSGYAELAISIAGTIKAHAEHGDTTSVEGGTND